MKTKLTFYKVSFVFFDIRLSFNIYKNDVYLAYMCENIKVEEKN